MVEAKEQCLVVEHFGWALHVVDCCNHGVHLWAKQDLDVGICVTQLAHVRAQTN